MDALLIFDFDGVIADSEVLSNMVLADIVTALGLPTTLEDSYARYMGKRPDDLVAAIEADLGRPLPEGFNENFQGETLDRFRRDLMPVAGVRDYIETFGHVPKCIASSSSPKRLNTCLDILALRDEFAPHVYSASMVERGKPHPDIFLHAAGNVGIEPNRCVVIEDSPSGVKAAIAAGMRVIGLTAASHIQHDHYQQLSAAGAHHVVATFDKAADATHRMLSELEA
ncbi:MAG: HAD family hydrolase [Pseudomonadota bacterium]